MRPSRCCISLKNPSGESGQLQLACVESKFAADSTGFGTVTYRRWYDAKYGREMKQAGWVKAHAMIGTTTNITPPSA